jgi:hypothetical protein
MPVDLVGFRDGDCAYVGDIRWFPVMITTFFGESNETQIRHWFDWYHGLFARLPAAGTRYVAITDATRSQRPPPTIRKLIAELTDAFPEPWTEACVATYVVLDSAIVRGALTAMQWLSSRSWRINPVASMADALEQAIAAMTKAGMPIPAGMSPAAYVAPAMPTAQGRTTYP